MTHIYKYITQWCITHYYIQKTYIIPARNTVKKYFRTKHEKLPHFFWDTLYISGRLQVQSYK